MIYLDNSATTKCRPEIANEISSILVDNFGNPSSLHKLGYMAEQIIKESKSIFCDIFNCKDTEIIFTSGGTESDNLAIIGYAMQNKKRGNHIISSKVEHDAVLNSLKFLENNGFEITLLDPNNSGVIEPEILEKHIKKETILISLMHVNNELGSINNITNLSKISKTINPNIIFHSDCVQSFGKYEVKNLGADMISISSHKIHGPKGVGILYKNQKVNISPLLYGGGQQNSIRPGTEDTQGIYGFAKAAQHEYKNREFNLSNFINIKNAYLKGLHLLNEKYGNIKVHSPNGDIAAPYILNVGFKDIRSEVLLHSLEEDDIYVGTGSACSLHSNNKTRVLSAIDVPDEYRDSSIRISLGDYNTIKEVDIVINSLDKKIPQLRKFVRK